MVSGAGVVTGGAEEVVGCAGRATHVPGQPIQGGSSYVCMYIRMYVCFYACMNVCMYTYIRMYLYVYVYNKERYEQNKEEILKYRRERYRTIQKKNIYFIIIMLLLCYCLFLF